MSLAKNVTYNIVKKKTTYTIIKVFYNMSMNPYITIKVFLIKQLVNMKMKKGESLTNHINEFSLIISRFIYVDIGFKNEVQTLLFFIFAS